MRRQNIILIGFMGAGKTSVGQRLASLVKRPLRDTDQMIEEKAGMTISSIFEKEGEAVFRKLETDVLEDLLKTAGGDIISVGGGLPLREENRIILKKLGTVIYLQVCKETVLKRLEGDTTRPLLQTEDLQARVESLLIFRDPVYQEAAHHIVNTDERTLDEIVREIIMVTGMSGMSERGDEDEAIGTERTQY